MLGVYRVCWVVAASTTGIVAGFMVSHALLLGRYLDWLLMSGRAQAVVDTYAVFTSNPGHGGLVAYYALSGLQVVAGVAFAVVSVIVGQHVLEGVLVGVASVLWPTVHYVSGFATLEARVLHAARVPSPDVVARFVRWNVPIHGAHAAMLLIALGTLLSVRLSAHRSSRGGSLRPGSSHPTGVERSETSSGSSRKS